MFAFSAIVLVLFGWNETRTTDPIVPMEFFRREIFAVANITGFLLSVGMFGTLLFLPLFVQGVLGQSAQNSGAILTPMMGSFIVSALVAGQLMSRLGHYKLIAVVSAVLMGGGLYLFTRVDVNAGWPIVVRDMIVLGLGIGGLLPILNVAVQNAFAYEVMGIVNAAQQFVRSLGSVIAAPILGTVLANVFAAQMQANMPPALAQAIAQLPPSAQQALTDPQSLTNAHAQAAIGSAFSAFGPAGTQLYQQFIALVRGSLSTGIRQLFMIALYFGIAAFVATLFLPEIPLKHDEFYEGTRPS
jgi:MFS family permease